MAKSLKHIVCAMSGGVDSAVAAYLLKKNGYQVTGCFMRNWNKLDESDSNCSVEIDHNDAEFVCKQLDLPFISVDFSKQYWNQVFCTFLDEYENGLTPNPDVLCNKHIKFPILFDYCSKNMSNFDGIATGHYARIQPDPKTQKLRMLKAKDELRDQTFFLSQVDSKLFGHILFPVGGMFKSQVKQIAKELGLDKIYNRKSTRGICMIGKREFSEFIDQYLPERAGQIYDFERDAPIGEHTGVHHFTIGQKISCIDPKLNSHKKPFYVAKKDALTNRIYAVPGTDHPALYFNEFEIEKPYWLCDNMEEEAHGDIILDERFSFKFQNRHYDTQILCLEKQGSKYITRLKQQFRSIVPGQYCVFYRGEECVGSAKIIRTGASVFESQSGNTGIPIINTDKLLTKKYK